MPEKTFAFGEFEKIQLEQSMETFRMIQDRLFMIILGLIVANVTIIGFAIDKQKPLIALIGIACYILMWFYIKVSRRFINAATITAMSIEEKYGDRSIEWLVTSSLKKTANKDVRNTILNIRKLNNLEDRLNIIQKLSSTGHTANKWLPELLIGGLCTIQISTVYYLVCYVL
jgi:hypothetical protein